MSMTVCLRTRNHMEIHYCKQSYIKTWLSNQAKKLRTNKSTSIFRHSGNCLHDADKIIFIVTEFSKHVKQAASHNLPTEQERIRLVDLPMPTCCKCTHAIKKHNSGQIKLYRADQWRLKRRTTFVLLNASNVEKHRRRILQLTLKFTMARLIYIKRIRLGW